MTSTSKDAKFVRDTRKALGMTQLELAELLHHTTRTIIRWENGDTPLPHNVRMFLNLLRNSPTNRRRVGA